MSLLQHLTQAASSCACSGAPRDPEAWGMTTPCPVSVSQILAGQRRNSVELRLSTTPCKNEDASTHCRARRMIKAMTSRSSAAHEAGAILLSNAMEDCQTEYIFEFQQNRSQMDIARGEPNVSKVGENFAKRKRLGVPFVPNCCSAMFEQEPE